MAFYVGCKIWRYTGKTEAKVLAISSAKVKTKVSTLSLSPKTFHEYGPWV